MRTMQIDGERNNGSSLPGGYSAWGLAWRLMAVFCGSFLFVVFLSIREVDLYDEGIILTAAWRVLQGDVPHRDFYTNYGPAPYYLLAGLFKLFGPSVLAERMLDATMRAGIVTLVYALVLPYGRKLLAILPVALCLLWLSTVGNAGYPVYPALLCALASTLILVRVLTRGATPGLVLVAGLLTGLTACFRYDVGFFAMLAHLLAAGLMLALARAAGVSMPSGFVMRLLPYVAGASLPIGLLAVYAAFGVLGPFFHDIVWFPLHFYGATRSLPFPDIWQIWQRLGLFMALTNLSIYVPLVTVALAGVYLVVDRRRIFVTGRDGITGIHPAAAALLLLACLAAFFYLKGVVRVSFEHMQLSLLPALAAMAVLCWLVGNSRKWLTWSVRGFMVLVCLSSVCVVLVAGENPHRIKNSLAQVMRIVESPDRDIANVSLDLQIPDGADASLYTVPWYRRGAAAYLVEHTRPDQRIFVGLGRHDKIFLNDVSVYFLTRRMPATRWHHFDPGLQTGEKVQREIAAELDRDQTPYAWLESTFDQVREPNASAVGSGVTLLDDYLQSHYRPEVSFGPITLYRRNDPQPSPAPDPAGTAR